MNETNPEQIPPDPSTDISQQNNNLEPPIPLDAPVKKTSKQKLLCFGIILSFITIISAILVALISQNDSSSYKWNTPAIENYPKINYALAGTWSQGDAQQPRYLDRLMDILKSDPAMKNNTNRDALALWLRDRQSTGADRYNVFNAKRSGYGPNKVLLFSWPATAPNLNPIKQTPQDKLNNDDNYEVKEFKSDLSLTGVLTSTYLIRKKGTNKVLRIDSIYFSEISSKFNNARLIAENIKWEN